MPSSIGSKRERPVIQQATETADSEGQPVKVWNNFTAVWARVEFLNGSELEAMHKINSEITTRFTMDYRTGVTVKMQIVWRNSSWNIHLILPTEDKFDVAVMASKVE